MSKQAHAQAQDRSLLVLPPPVVRQGLATVVAEPEQQGGDWLIEAEGERLGARRAASCLLAPAVGDTVWFVGREDRGHYLTTVLERGRPDVPANLQVDGDAELRVDGRLSLAAREGLELATDARLDLRGDELRVRARLGRALIDECSLVLRSLFSHVTRSTFVGKALETLVDRFTQHSKTSYRTVTELDQVQAGVIDHRASASAQLHGKQTLITGEELVKAEGRQIHLG